jgi:diacylglycerol kinase family enzyme
MQFLAILNRDGGTLRSTDLAALSAFLTRTMEAADHRVEIEIVEGRQIVEALERAVARGDIDVVLAGGGDGTISAAAAALMNTDKTLAVLPAGTMNLFARGLGLSLTLEQAIEGHARGHVKAVDVASANGRPFVHQFSIGLHARMVQLRSRFEYGSRLGKIWASVRAAFAVLRHPPAIAIVLDVGEAEIRTTTTGLGVSNNVFGKGHLPYADAPDGGVLGIYVAGIANRATLAWLFLAMTLGRWQETEIVEIHECETATLTILSPTRHLRCVIDGELSVLEKETVLKIHPKALKVLVPEVDAAAAP